MIYSFMWKVCIETSTLADSTVLGLLHCPYHCSIPLLHCPRTLIVTLLTLVVYEIIADEVQWPAANSIII